MKGRTSNIQRGTSNIQHPTSNIQSTLRVDFLREAPIGRWMLDVGCWMFNSEGHEGGSV
jgi:hypothetical protein